MTGKPRVPFSPALLTDLYELMMLQAYFAEHMMDMGVFSLFVRRLPKRRNYLLACGLDDVLAFLETLRFDQPALAYLDSLGQFSAAFLRYLEASALPAMSGPSPRERPCSRTNRSSKSKRQSPNRSSSKHS